MSILKEDIKDMGNYEVVVFISCWHCYEFLLMNNFISKFLCILNITSYSIASFA